VSRVDLKALLKNEAQRRQLFAGVIRATQAAAGIDTSQADAEAAYDRVRAERVAAEEAQAQPIKA